FKQHGPVAVMLGRFLVPLRQLQGYVAGNAKMGFWRFAWWSFLVLRLSLYEEEEDVLSHGHSEGFGERLLVECGMQRV
ncbi:MAG: hypothetical protein PHO55_15135, partial [Thiomonas arsenitoxydans]|nr:hypothetical protein [Thiomonas arsenitoxydans]